MARIDGLVRAYEAAVKLPWPSGLSGAEKVWCALYDPADERRLRARLEEFEAATLRTQHTWAFCDLTDLFARWLASLDYRESYFAAPDDLAMELDDFVEAAASEVVSVIESRGSDPNMVIGVCGIGSLFGITRASKLIERVNPSIAGRMLIFFPGEQDGHTFRLFSARDGWNYLAVAIRAKESN